MDQKYKETEEERQSAQKRLESLQQQYERYPQLLQRLEEASAPLQSSFGIASDIIAAKLQEAKILPGPLYSIYTKLEGYKQQTGDESLDVKIVGDHSKAESMIAETVAKAMPKVAAAGTATPNPKEVAAAEEEEKKGEISDSSRKIRKKKQKKSSRREKPEDNAATLFASDVKYESLQPAPAQELLQKFPLSVQITLTRAPAHLGLPREAEATVAEVFPLELYFFYYPHLNLVTCSAKSRSGRIGSLQLLHSLFAEDDGHYALEYLKESHVAWNNEDERPYSWVHFLAGVYDFAFLAAGEAPRPRAGEAHFYDPTSVNAAAVLRKVRSRVVSLGALLYQLDYLSKNRRIEPEIMGNLAGKQQFKLVKDKCIVREFNPIVREFFVAGVSQLQPDVMQSQRGVMADAGKTSSAVPLSLPTFVRAEDGSYVKTYRENASPCLYDAGFYYNVLVERGVYNVRGFIEIGYNYPNTPPHIILKMESAKKAAESKAELLARKEDLQQIAELETGGNNFGYSHVLKVTRGFRK